MYSSFITLRRVDISVALTDGETLFVFIPNIFMFGFVKFARIRGKVKQFQSSILKQRRQQLFVLK